MQRQLPAKETQQTASPTVSPAPQAPTPQQKVDELRGKVAADSLNFHLHFELANALDDAGQKEEALVEYDKALSIEPDFVEAMVNRGAVYNELGRIPDAIASFQKALALKPNDTRALVNLGNSYYALKDYGNAMKQYELAVAVDSTFAEAYYYIGIAFADAGIYREAVREWEKIIQVAPNSEAARNARENIDALKSFMQSQ
jgi:tetratricopeptide (TPR) repeat protein